VSNNTTENSEIPPKPEAIAETEEPPTAEPDEEAPNP